MENLDRYSLTTYIDSSYNNLNNGDSQLGFTIFWSDKTRKLSAIILQSKRICWVVKSMAAAET